MKQIAVIIVLLAASVSWGQQNVCDVPGDYCPSDDAAKVTPPVCAKGYHLIQTCRYGHKVIVVPVNHTCGVGGFYEFKCLPDQPTTQTAPSGINTSVSTGTLAAVSSGQQSFHNCSQVGGSGNSPHLFDVSKTYRCDEGEVEVSGRRTMTIEYGYVFEQEMGEPIGEPRPVTSRDYADFKWCPTPHSWDANQKEMCGDKPRMCWDGKPGTWDKNWQGYSCVTPDHNGKLATPTKKEKAKP